MTEHMVMDAAFAVTGGAVTRSLKIKGGELTTTEIAIGRWTAEVHSRELALVVDSAAWRYDIPTWRWRASATSMDDAWADPTLDDADWRVVPHLHPVFDATTLEESWFRTELDLAGRIEDEPVRIVLGGMDDEDWSEYVAYLDGVRLDAWSATGSIREPHSIVLALGDPRIASLKARGPNVLAVRARGLDRSVWRVQPGEREHYFHQGWLLDQFVAGGEPTLLIDDFVATSHHHVESDEIVTLQSRSTPGITAELRFSSFASGVRKRITVRNDGPAAITLLDVIGDAWSDVPRAAGGGRGQPVLLDGVGFVGIEHPAGVNQCDGDRVRLVQMPGVTIDTGATWTARPIVLGGSSDDGAEAAFQEYVRDLRERPTTRKRVYSALGWYDFTNPADPLPELTSDLIAENLRQLGDLRDLGAAFDIYMIDDWWESTDLGSFRARAYPNGAAPIGRAIREAGMDVGLWWATSRALWTAERAPGIERSLANDPGFGVPVALSGGAWRWLEEFANVFIGERRFCLASEPYRSMYQAAIPALVDELNVALLKLDCVVLHCTSSAHGHRAGRHSVEAMVDALEDLIERCRARRPDIRIIWYWGFRSPWYLGLGDMVFDKGLLMEAATPASAPMPTSRQAMSLNVDQSIEHAAVLPLELQDSLGVWIGDVAWCNRVGREEWREAYLLDIARGSDLVQLWGDMTLFDAEDRAFLAAVQPWVERHGADGARTTRLGGSAWREEPYAYARPASGGVLVTVTNPTWSATTFALGPALLGLPEGPWRIVELYPFPGLVEGPSVIDLAPLEVRVLHVVPLASVPSDVVRSHRPIVRATRTIDASALAVTSNVAAVSADLTMPALGLGDAIYVATRLSRDGQWAYDAEPQARIRLSVTLDGLAVRAETMPRTRDRNGPGSSWVLHRIPAGPAWSDRSLHISLTSDTADAVTITTSALAIDEWWRRTDRTFRDLIRP